MEVDHKERAHALLSASGASRWIACTPSPRLEEGFAEDESSTYAAEGTLAHELAELMLRKWSGAIELGEYRKALNKIKKSPLYSAEMPEEVRKYTDYIEREFNAAKKKTGDPALLIEEKVSLEPYIKKGFGTCDANIVADGTLKVNDLKYGKGVRVDAKDNPQLRLYALGALMAYDLSYDIQRVRMTIIQPRLDHISSEELTVADLVIWAIDVIKPAAKLAYAGEGELKAGSHCRWCKAAPRCRALSEKNLAIAKEDFCDPSLLSDEELIEVYKQMPELSAWVSTVAKYLLAEAIGGRQWPEHKLVEGKSNRKFVNEAEAINVLLSHFTEDEALNKKPKGLGDLEKLVKEHFKLKGQAGTSKFNELLGPLIIKPPGAPTLVHESDKRQPMNSADQAKKDFSDNLTE